MKIKKKIKVKSNLKELQVQMLMRMTTKRWRIKPLITMLLRERGGANLTMLKTQAAILIKMKKEDQT